MSKLFKIFILFFLVGFLFLSIKALAQIPGSTLTTNTNAPAKADTNLNAAPTPELLGQANNYPTYSGKGITVTVEQVGKAGFSGVKADLAIDSRINSGRDNYPVFYFRVNETVLGEQGKAWGDASNLVAVFIRQMPADWSFNVGQMQVTDLAGRTQATISKGEYYFEVTGPVHDSVVNLAGILENSY